MNPRTRLSFAVLVLAALVAVPASAQGPAPGVPGPAPRPMIITTVTEEVEIVPDRAMLAFAVETHARTAAAAGAENARIQSAVLDTLRKLGVAAAQLRTSGLSISPEYEYPKAGGRPTVVGYQAVNSVRVEIRDLSTVGRVIDAGLAKGSTNVGALQFFASSTEAAGRDALRKAVARSRADADAIADAAGARVLGLELLTVLPGQNAYPRPELAMAMSVRSAGMADVQTPVEVGTLKVSVTVEARYLFAPR